MSPEEQWEREQELRYHKENSFENRWGVQRQQTPSLASVLAQRRQSSVGVMNHMRGTKRPAAEISLSPPTNEPPITTVTLPPDNWNRLVVDTLSDVGSPGRDVPDFHSSNGSSFGLHYNHPQRMQPPNPRYPLQGIAEFQHPGQFSSGSTPRRNNTFHHYRSPTRPQSGMDPSQRFSHQQTRRGPLDGIDLFRKKEPKALAYSTITPHPFSLGQNDPQAPPQHRGPIPGIDRFRNDRLEANDQAPVHPPDPFSLDPEFAQSGSSAPSPPPPGAPPPGHNGFFRPDLRNGIAQFQGEAHGDIAGMLQASLAQPHPGFLELASEVFTGDAMAHFQEMAESSPGMDTGVGIPQFQGMPDTAPGMCSGGSGGIAKFQVRPSAAAPVAHDGSSLTEQSETFEDMAREPLQPQVRSQARTTDVTGRVQRAVSAVGAMSIDGPVQADDEAAATAQAPLQFQTYRAPPQPASAPAEPSAMAPAQTPYVRNDQSRSETQLVSLPYQTPTAANRAVAETTPQEMAAESSENIAYSPPTYRSPPLDQNAPQISFFFGDERVDQRGTPIGSKAPREQRRNASEAEERQASVESRDDASHSSSAKSDREASRVLQERRNESIWRRTARSSQDKDGEEPSSEKKPASISYNAWKESSNSDNDSDSDDDSWDEIEKELKKRQTLWRG